MADGKGRRERTRDLQLVVFCVIASSRETNHSHTRSKGPSGGEKFPSNSQVTCFPLAVLNDRPQSSQTDLEEHRFHVTLLVHVSKRNSIGYHPKKPLESAVFAVMNFQRGNDTLPRS
ncbi:MAG: hypothetical protein ACKN81_20800 [Pirellulaceae bacterium]